MRMLFLRGMTFVLACGVFFGQSPDIKVLFPTNGPKPVGPYSPGLAVGDYVFVSGQGVGDGSGKRATETRAQAVQCMNNVRNILRLGGMDLANVFSLQVYLTDKSQETVVTQVLKDMFSGKIPTHNVQVMPKLPVTTPLEITAFAHKARQTGDLEPPSLDRPSGCKALKQFVQCGVEVAAGGVDVEQQTAAVLGALDARLRLLGTSLSRAVATNVYLSDIEDFPKMNAVYASFFLLRAPTRSTTQPFALPKGRVAISVIAAK